MLHIKFQIIGQLVLEKKIFVVFTIYWHGGHVDHVTPYLRLHMKFGSNWPIGSTEVILKSGR